MDFPLVTPQPGTGLALNLNGVLPVKNLTQLQAEERAAAEATNSRPYITNLAGHIRKQWTRMQEYKRMNVEPRLLACMRQRKGEYDSEKLSLIRKQGGSEIFMMLSSNKARAASAWIRDTTTDPEGGPLPYKISATPVPDVPPNELRTLYQEMEQELAQARQWGVVPSESEMREYIRARKDMVMAEVREQAQASADRMKAKMDDQLVEGGIRQEFGRFVDDLSTFPYAVMKGPVVKKRKGFKWVPSMDGQFELQVTDELLPTWERIDPFMLYWMPHCTDPDDGDLVERHRLTRADLDSMIGVEGYSDAAIRAVLDEFGRGGLSEWLWIDAQKAVVEGKGIAGTVDNSGHLIDALQFWGSVQGKLLIEWGIDEAEIEDPLLDYQVEAWLIGNWVIKAVINPDPLGRKPYYKTAYEEIPGAWVGNSPMDLIRDCQDVCNASARALVNNMGISSGPQVWLNVDRMPSGENVTQLYPWKIHQVTSDPMGASSPPIGFFQPESLAGELMAVYEKFATLADEYSGLPRYIAGDQSNLGSVGRTASGMSMLMNNAGKAIKQVINNIDRNVIEPMIERLWFYNMRYSDDMDLKGDVKINARGATALVMKESATQRRNELLQIALNSPVAQQIMGMEGTAHLLREQAKTLDLNADRIVPDPEIVRARAAVQQAQMQAAQQAQMNQAAMRQGATPMSQPNQMLEDGTPITDNFSPMRMN